MLYEIIGCIRVIIVFFFLSLKLFFFTRRRRGVYVSLFPFYLRYLYVFLLFHLVHAFTFHWIFHLVCWLSYLCICVYHYYNIMCMRANIYWLFCFCFFASDVAVVCVYQLQTTSERFNLFNQIWKCERTYATSKISLKFLTSFTLLAACNTIVSIMIIYWISEMSFT